MMVDMTIEMDTPKSRRGRGNRGIDGGCTDTVAPLPPSGDRGHLAGQTTRPARAVRPSHRMTILTAADFLGASAGRRDRHGRNRCM